MKNLFTIIFIAISITRLLSACQNNLNQSTKTILDNVANLKKKAQEVPAELKPINQNLSSEQILLLLLTNGIKKKSGLDVRITNRKNSLNHLETILNSFNIDHWIDYLAIHNQMFNAIKNEINTVNDNPNLHKYCKNFAQKIITIFSKIILTYYEDDTISKNDLLSLICAYQDYVNLFNNYIKIDDDIKIDDEKIIAILKEIKK